jgi:hypothetical protein
MVDIKAGAGAGTNLAVIPDAGKYGTSGSYWDYYEVDPNTWTANVHLDSSVTFNGDVSIRLDPHTSADVNTARECDGTWLNCEPGDVISTSIWILCANSSIGDTSPYDGARMGMDCYAHTSAGYGIVDGYPQSYSSNQSTEHLDMMVTWGSNTWTQKTLTYIIPSTYYTNDETNGRTCNPVQIDSFVLWLQVMTPTDKGLAWFADAELYITPTTSQAPTTYSLTVAGSIGGTTSLRAGSYNYAPGTVVQVQASPNRGYTFSKWLLDGASQGSSPSINVTMNANHTLQAVFTRTRYG